MVSKSRKPETPEERLAELREGHSHSRTQQIVATIHDSLSKPTWIVADGVAYRRERDQEETMRYLKESDMLSDFLERFGLAAFDALFEITSMQEAGADHHRGQIEERLLTLLPKHRPIIRACFSPDDLPVTCNVEYQHGHCHLPPLEEEEDSDGE